MNLLYRWRPTNWLMAKPWRWNYRTIYQTLRRPQHAKERTWGGYGPVKAAWYALCFPHVHGPEDE